MQGLGVVGRHTGPWTGGQGVADRHHTGPWVSTASGGEINRAMSSVRGLRGSVPGAKKGRDSKWWGGFIRRGTTRVRESTDGRR